MIDDAGRGDFSGIMSTHSVGHDPEAGFRLDQIAVLIELADAAPVADAEAFKGKGDIVQFATKRFASVLCGAFFSARSRQFATGADIRVSKSTSERLLPMGGVTMLER